MDFKLWESSFNNLYKNIEITFPNTTKRQHATQPIEIGNLRMTPYQGVKTLFVRVDAKNEDRIYSPMILFKQVRYKDVLDENSVNITSSSGKSYIIEKLKLDTHHLSIRCQCEDFYWRFHHWNRADKALYGRDRTPYTRTTDSHPPANPTELPGMCKHIIKMVEVLKNSGLFTS